MVHDSSEALRDIMGLLALPALWLGKDAGTVLHLMSDAVDSLVPLDVVHVQVWLPERDCMTTLLRLGRSKLSEQFLPEWAGFVEHFKQGSVQRAHRQAVESPIGRLNVVYFHLGAGKQSERVGFGSREPSFPTREQLAFLRAAATLASTGLHSARLDYERERARRAKDEFLAMLGHELRNPLAPIVTALGLIRLKGSAHLASEHAIIERQVAHLSHLVDDLLDITRITRDKIDLQLQPVSLRQVLTEAVEAVSPLVKQRRHQVHLALENLAAIVDGDFQRLRQVFVNILINAAKYTEPGGRISVSARVDGAHAIVEVQDTGCGIPPTLLPRVFDLFQQGNTALDRSQGGLGIGLALVKKLVELHGGQVHAQSEGVGSGSTFTVTVPLASQDAASKTGHPIPEVRGSRLTGKRVMIVDDNTDARETLALLLAMNGIEAHTASDGAQALAQAPLVDPDVFVLDIGLPGIDGYQLARELRRALPARATPQRFIALTGYGQATDKAKAADAGFSQHLTKPVEAATLLAAIAEEAGIES